MFKLATLIYRSPAGTAPAYLYDECRLTSSFALHHLLQCALCAQLTPRHLVTHTMVTVFAVLPLPVLVFGTVCHCTFENWTFHSTV